MTCAAAVGTLLPILEPPPPGGQERDGSAGRVGLVEFIPSVAGLEEGLALPSVDLLFGLRTETATEFAAGLNLCPGGLGVTAAVGRIFRAGDMGFPVNLAVAGNQEGVWFSITFGWNLRR